MKIAAYIASQAVARPQGTALVCGATQVSFADLHEQSDRVATSLRNGGVRVGDRVAIYLPNCCEFVIIFVAVVKCGAIALPINLRLAPREIDGILEDAEPVAAFVDASGRDTLSALTHAAGVRRFVVGTEALEGEVSFREMSACEARPIDVPVEHDDCLISYTSGTTGRPKGVVTTQANYIVANGFLNAAYWGVDAEARILVTTPLAHRTAFARFGNMAVMGASLHILPRFDVAEAVRVIRDDRITLLSIVPTVGRLLLPLIEEDPAAFASLRVLVATGEAFPLDIKRRLLEALPHLRIFSFLAMTEAGSLAMLKPEEQLTHGSSVGRVTPGVEIRLVDAESHAVPTGEAGEIWVRCGRPGQYLLFREYFRQAEATRDAFEGDWFKTGDIGRFDIDGYLYVVDRKKDMVLSGGYNIYSKEVENVLMQHPCIADAAIVGVPDDRFGEAVAAFVEVSKGEDLTEAALIAWCVGELAGYKKPKYVTFVDELPKNAMGKVLKNELRRLFADRASAAL